MSKRSYARGCLVMAGVLGLTFLYGGCVVDLQGDGKVWMDWGNRLEFGHRADKSTPDQHSESEWNFQPSKDFIDGMQKTFGGNDGSDDPESEALANEPASIEPAPDEG